MVTITNTEIELISLVNTDLSGYNSDGLYWSTEDGEWWSVGLVAANRQEAINA